MVCVGGCGGSVGDEKEIESGVVWMCAVVAVVVVVGRGGGVWMWSGGGEGI